MTREEAIEIIENGGWWDLLIPVTTIEGRIEEDKLHEALDMALSALRPVSREQVEKVWRGEWIKKDGYTECSKCEYWYDSPENEDDGDRQAFCPSCGAPMTDEAVDMVMERLDVLYASDT